MNLYLKFIPRRRSEDCLDEDPTKYNETKNIKSEIVNSYFDSETKLIDTFTISFFYNQILCTVNFNGNKQQSTYSFVISNQWERYMLINVEEKNRFSGLILKSIDHESKTPLNLVIN